MSVVVTFERFLPPARYDSLPWTEARVEESDAEDGTFTQIDAFTLTPVDADPEDPAYRSFTTELGTAAEYWYRVVFADADDDTSVPTDPIQNLAGTGLDVQPYATTSELAAILKVNAATNEDALTSVLMAAAGEINAEIGRDNLSGWEVYLAQDVNLRRAVMLWHARPVGFNIVGLDSEAPIRLPRDSWDTFANELAPLKAAWGLA